MGVDTADSGNKQEPGQDPGLPDCFREYADADNRKDIQGMANATAKLWEHLAEVRQNGPSPWLEAMERAHEFEAVFDWEAAEAAYRFAIHVSAENPGLQSGSYGYLSGFHFLLGNDKAALEAAETATQIARTTDISSLLSSMLQAQARVHLRLDNIEAARAALNEALEVMGRGGLCSVSRAKALILRTECQLREGDLSKAEEDLEAAWKLAQPFLEAHFAAGWQSSLASWWEATARVRARQNKTGDVAAAWKESIARRRIVTEAPQLEGPYKHNWLAQTLFDAANALRRIGDESAEGFFKESDSIRRAIGLPPFAR